MKKRILWVALALTIVLATPVLSGCTTPVQLDQEFTLALGQGARVSGTGLQVGFLAVTEDSRCPTGVECIWAGRVGCRVDVIKAGMRTTLELKTIAGSEGTASFDGYTLKFSVSPYPEAGRRIPAGAYRLHLTISQSQQNGAT